MWVALQPAGARLPADPPVDAPGRPRPAFEIGSVTIDGVATPVSEATMARRPFARLLRFRCAIDAARPRVLLVAPLSGHSAALMRDMVMALLPGHDVCLVAWEDAREVPLAAGPFGLEHNIAYVRECLRDLGPGTHLVGLCQSCVPALAATALLAAEGDPAEPRSLSLIAGPIDVRAAPSRIAHLLGPQPPAILGRELMATVPTTFPGRGRRIHPAGLRLAALLLHLRNHIACSGELFQKLVCDDGLDPERHPFLELYTSVMDLPAELVLDTVRLVFQEHALARGRLSCKGVPVDPGAIVRTPLLTIEGARDDVVTPGQTRAAHALCRNLPPDRHRHHLEPMAGHFGLFHGAIWRERVLPVLAAFIDEAEAAAAPPASASLDAYPAGCPTGSR
jgi:poly(3-hydroxybutyrate) depolymerase